MVRTWLNSAEVDVTDDALLVRTSGGVTVKRAKISAAANGDNELVALVATKKIKVLGIFLIAAEAVVGTLYSGAQATGTAITGPISLVASSGFVLAAPTDPAANWLETAAGANLNLYLSAAKQVSGALVYYEQA